MITTGPIIDRATSSRANLLGEALGLMLIAPAQIAAALAELATRRVTSPCEIPPPCWEPRRLGKCTLVLPPDTTGTIRLHISNCNWQRQVVVLGATGPLATLATLVPSTRVVEMQSEALMGVRIHIPAEVKPGRVISGGILVRGCLNHFLRVEVRVAECAVDTCCDVTVKDCQDQVHHWYDHFYCARPCHTVTARTPNRTPATNEPVGVVVKARTQDVSHG